MRASTIGKLAVVVFLTGCTSWATSAILAQTRAARNRGVTRPAVRNGAANDDAGTVCTLTEVLTVRRDDPGAVNALQPPVLVPGRVIPAPMISSIGLNRIEAAGLRRSATVAVDATIIETLPNRVFLWSLRVYTGSPERKPLSRHDYNAQIFQTPPGAEVHPTFRETIPLPPGRYVVQVNLHRISPDFDLSKLADEKTNRATRVISGWKDVVVTD